MIPVLAYAALPARVATERAGDSEFSSASAGARLGARGRGHGGPALSTVAE